MFRFPLNEWLRKSLRDLQKKSPIAKEIIFDDLKIKWFPPGVFFKNISFVYKNKRVELDSAFISISLKHWIAFKKAFNLKFKQGESSFFVNFQRQFILDEKSLEDKKQEIYSIKGFSSHINLEDLTFLYPNMLGVLKTQFFYKGSVQYPENIKGEINLNGKNIVLSELQLNTLLGPLSLPSIEWTQLELKIQMKEGELIFEKVNLGEAGDQLKVKMRGSGAFGYSRGSFRLNSYNIELEIDIDKTMEFGFLDLMFANYKESKSNFYRYSIRLTGQGSQVPKIEKLEKF